MTVTLLLSSCTVIEPPDLGKYDAPSSAPSSSEPQAVFVKTADWKNLSAKDIKAYRQQFHSQLTDMRTTNRDVCGILLVPEYGIANPIVMPKDNTKYLYLNYKQEFSELGTLCVDEDADSLSVPNLVLYGNSQDGAPLSFIQHAKDTDNPVVGIYTTTGLYVYQLEYLYETSDLQAYTMPNPEDLQDVVLNPESNVNSTPSPRLSKLLTLSTGGQSDDTRLVAQYVQLGAYTFM